MDNPRFPSGIPAKAWALLLHIVFPKTCPACGNDLALRHPKPLCPECEGKLNPLGSLICQRCGIPLPDGGAHCWRCRGYKAESYKCEIIRSAFIFEEPARALIHALKYRGQRSAAVYLGAQLAAALSRYAEISGCDLLVPVPLAAGRLRERGFNQSLLLAEELAKTARIAVAGGALVKTRSTESQAKLKREERIRNLEGAFAVASPEAVKGKNILLIDDVATTGATLEACAASLKKSGAAHVYALTAARE